jgi:hypothetical protein
MKKNLWMLAAILTLCGVMKAQTAEVSDSLKQDKRSTDAVFYKYNYPSVDAEGKDVVLSSLLVAWNPEEPNEDDGIESVHIYSHFTITSDDECPTSEMNLKESVLFSFLANGIYGLGSDEDQNFISRCIIIAPDYEGYGVTKDLAHPYLAQELTARQMTDAVDYGLRLYNKHVNDKRALQFKSDWRSFGFGFSQGGAVALAVQRRLEQLGMDRELRYRGSIVGDGPYDLIATMRYYMDDDGNSYDTETDHHKGITTMPMVIPMIIQGMLDTHPDLKSHKLEDYLSQQFLDTGIMEWIKSKELTINNIHERWYEQLQEGFEADGRTYTKEQMEELFQSPKEDKVWAHLDKLFTTQFYDYLADASNFNDVPTEKGDACKDLHRALADNGVASGWQPKHRIQFVHSKGDMVVPYGNYLSFRDAHPDGEGDWYKIDDSVTPSDHIAVGTEFFLYLCTTGTYGEVFQWLDEDPASTGINDSQLSIVNYQFSNAWYTLDGRRLNGKPTVKGLYIYNGKKVVIK